MYTLRGCNRRNIIKNRARALVASKVNLNVNLTSTIRRLLTAKYVKNILYVIILLLFLGQPKSSLGGDFPSDSSRLAPSGATVDLTSVVTEQGQTSGASSIGWAEDAFEQLWKSKRSPIEDGQPVESYPDNGISIRHEDGLCNLTTMRSNAQANTPRPFIDSVDVYERILTCSHVNEDNYRKWFAKMATRSNVNIHRIHIISSDSMLIFPVIDLICSSYNCSTLVVFNVSGHQIHDPSRLASWLSQWPQLEILDLSNSSLKSIESILYHSSAMEGNTVIDRSSVGAKEEASTSSSKLVQPTSNAAQKTIQLNELTKLVLDYNNIIELDFDFVFDRMPNLRYVSVLNNSILDIRCHENQWPRFRSQIEFLNLANNSINCDKSHLWLIKQFASSLTNLKFPDSDQIRCSSSSLADMTWSQRVSVLETRICDYCDCRSLKRTAISVDCHNKNLTSLPDELPLNTKILNLTSNRINSLSVPYKSRNWENVTYVYLENNLISTFNPLEFSPKFMRNLAALDIRRNKFQEFPSHILEQFINLDQIHLSNNPWLCDCESTFAFQEWLQRHFHKVGDKEEIRCGISGNEENGLKSNSLQQRLSARVIYKLSKSELCPQENLEEPYDWLDVVNFSLAIAIILIVSKVIMDYIYQHRTKRLPHFFKLNIL